MTTAAVRTIVAPRAAEDAAAAGWAEDDLAAAWAVFRHTAVAALVGSEPLRPAKPIDDALRAVFLAAVALPEALDNLSARRFFEQRFVPTPLDGPGFLTGYYEPVVAGSSVRSTDFDAPILPRPDDLVTLPQGNTSDGLPAGFSAGRRRADGTLEPYADRSDLEAFALTGDAKPVVWLRDWTEVFLIQVQGSARVRLEDGSEIRLVYAGRNGHPYTSIGRILIDSGAIPQTAMTLDALKSWIRQNGQARDQAGRRLMQRNSSYIFFRAEAARPSETGPTGGAGLPLTPLRSIAIDRSLWPYGLPFWITTTEPVPGFSARPLRRLFIAQDTGSAILGAARADLFLGSGDEAGRLAGAIRHDAHFTALVPRSS